MGRSWHEGEWERGAKRGWRAKHRVRRNKKGKIIEEEYVERSFIAMVVGLPILAVFLWWTQARLDGWLQLAVAILAVLVSIYATYLILMVWLVEGASRLLKSLID